MEDSIKWSKVREVNPRRKGDKICGLCNSEKTHIAVGNPDVLLNRRHEIMQRCRHRDNLVLSNNFSIRNVQRISNTGREAEAHQEENTSNLPSMQVPDPLMVIPSMSSSELHHVEREERSSPPGRRKRGNVDYSKFF